MSGAIPPFPPYTFMAWYSFKKSTGTTLPFIMPAQWYSAGLRAGWSGVQVSLGTGNFSLWHRVQTGSGAQLPSYPMGTRGSFLGGVKLTTHLLLVPTSNNAWRHTSTPQYAFMAWSSVKAQTTDDRVSISGTCWEISPHHRVQTGCGAHPASCPIGTTCSFPGLKRPGC
jgi:hypothetical protein